MPCVFYGDEIGTEGFEDPFCRQTYPWGHEDLALQSWFFTLGQLRRRLTALQKGKLRWLHLGQGAMVYARETDDQAVVVLLNAGQAPEYVSFTWDGDPLMDAITGQAADNGNQVTVTMEPRSVMILST